MTFAQVLDFFVKVENETKGININVEGLMQNYNVIDIFWDLRFEGKTWEDVAPSDLIYIL